MKFICHFLSHGSKNIIFKLIKKMYFYINCIGYDTKSAYKNTIMQKKFY